MSDVTRAEFLELKEKVDSACSQIKEVKQNTGDIVDAFQAVQGGFKVLQAIGKLARPLGYIAAACAAFLSLYAAMKGFFGGR